MFIDNILFKRYNLFRNDFKPKGEKDDDNKNKELQGVKCGFF